MFHGCVDGVGIESVSVQFSRGISDSVSLNSLWDLEHVGIVDFDVC